MFSRNSLACTSNISVKFGPAAAPGWPRRYAASPPLRSAPMLRQPPRAPPGGRAQPLPSARKRSRPPVCTTNAGQQPRRSARLSFSCKRAGTICAFAKTVYVGKRFCEGRVCPSRGPRGTRMIHPVILSGGSGTRLWPMSRTLYPKQLLPLLGRDSLLQQAVRRVADRAGLRAAACWSPMTSIASSSPSSCARSRSRRARSSSSRSAATPRPPPASPRWRWPRRNPTR